MELFGLELQHERDVVMRRLQWIVAGALLFLMGAIALETALVALAVALGVPIWLSALFVGLLNFVLGYVVIHRFSRRTSADGTVFQMTRAEISRTTEWIKTCFFSNRNGSATK